MPRLRRRWRTRAPSLRRASFEYSPSCSSETSTSLDLPSLESVDSWQGYCTGGAAASADYTPGMSFPTTRLGRLRHTPGIRWVVREARPGPADMIQPLFVRHGGGPSDEIAS